MENENFFEKCRTCQHCHMKNDDDYVFCRKRNGKCEYRPYKSRKRIHERVACCLLDNGNTLQSLF